ncbi:trimeric LpxA-like protein [Echria macrotheca]|uniref:Trimeric LpxA-like protein n=1 Tax=Echria macrotheca TaxID=438768 RepID=A0AAJ0F4L5_9PEZI|nr:trimeric LpxA-like protein [Echria macrotheca]
MDSSEESDVAPAVGIAFPAGNDDFRAARDRCAQACRLFNETPEDSPAETRSRLFLDIIRPGRDRNDDAAAAVTHDMTFRNPSLKAQTPFVKPPFYVDYGLRVRIGGSTFINRSCMIMDTPVADVIIGERCNIGPNCCIVSVGHALRAEERSGKQSSIGKPIVIGDHVWIGANVTVLGGVTIGAGAVIGAGSVITKNIPPSTMALGVPARVVQDLNEAAVGTTDFSDTVETLTEAMRYGRELDRKEEHELAQLSLNLSMLQQRKKAHMPQQAVNGVCQAGDSPRGRRGSEQSNYQDSLLSKPPIIAAGFLAGVVFAVIIGLGIAAIFWWTTCKKCTILQEQLSPAPLK